MSLATATYSINDIDHLLRKPTASGATWVSRARVTVTGGADDTYETDGIAPSAASCGLTKINTIKVLGAVTGAGVAVHGQQAALGATTPKIKLFVSSTGAEVANAVDITDYVFLLEVEGYAP